MKFCLDSNIEWIKSKWKWNLNGETPAIQNTFCSALHCILQTIWYYIIDIITITLTLFVFFFFVSPATLRSWRFMFAQITRKIAQARAPLNCSIWKRQQKKAYTPYWVRSGLPVKVYCKLFPRYFHWVHLNFALGCLFSAHFKVYEVTSVY